MFARLFAHLQLRRSTAFLLERGDDRLLDDIGLTRADLEAMHLSMPQVDIDAGIAKFFSLPSRRTLSVAQ